MNVDAPEWIPGYRKRRIFRREPRYWHPRRLTAAVTILTGVALLCAGLFTPFWVRTDTSGSPGNIGHDSAAYYPGRAYLNSCYQASQNHFCGFQETYSGEAVTSSFWESYCSTALGACSVGSNFQELQPGTLAAIAMSIIGAGLAVSGAFGLNFGRWQFLLTMVFGVAGGITVFANVLWATVASGTAIASPTTFWHSSTANGIATSWSPSSGWFLMIAGGLLVVMGTWVHAGTRKDPYTLPEVRGEMGRKA